jgi:hypothetical protein
MLSFIECIYSHNYHYIGQMNDNEMGGSFGTYGGKRNTRRNLVREYVGKNYLEDLGVDNIETNRK